MSFDWLIYGLSWAVSRCHLRSTCIGHFCNFSFIPELPKYICVLKRTYKKNKQTKNQIIWKCFTIKQTLAIAWHSAKGGLTRWFSRRDWKLNHKVTRKTEKWNLPLQSSVWDMSPSSLFILCPHLPCHPLFLKVHEDCTARPLLLQIM